jgi:hypothetical protein
VKSRSGSIRLLRTLRPNDPNGPVSRQACSSTPIHRERRKRRDHQLSRKLSSQKDRLLFSASLRNSSATKSLQSRWQLSKATLHSQAVRSTEANLTLKGDNPATHQSPIWQKDLLTSLFRRSIGNKRARVGSGIRKSETLEISMIKTSKFVSSMHLPIAISRGTLMRLYLLKGGLLHLNRPSNYS